MKFFVAFSALLAVASSSGLYYSPILVRSGTQPNVQKYHTQDDLGQYSYGYSEPLSAKEEVRTLDGVTRGSYSYQDPKGELQTVDYIADAGGFRVAATNLPKPVEIPAIIPAEAPLPVTETPEVAAARSAHLVAFEEAKQRGKSASSFAPAPASLERIDLPRPVEDTPEVALAKVEHFNAVENAKLRNAVLEANEGLPVQGAQIISAGSPFQYISGAAHALPIEYRSAVLPSGFSYSYGLNGAAIPGNRFLTSHYIYQ